MLTEITKTSFVIAVPDLRKSAAFYRDVLGFSIHSVSDPGCHFPRHPFPPPRAFYEEPRLRKQFGLEWTACSASVNRWLPRLPPWNYTARKT